MKHHLPITRNDWFLLPLAPAIVVCYLWWHASRRITLLFCN